MQKKNVLIREQKNAEQIDFWNKYTVIKYIFVDVNFSKIIFNHIKEWKTKTPL